MMSECGEPVRKVAKVAPVSKNAETEHRDFTGFQLVDVLNEDTRRKVMFVEGRFNNKTEEEEEQDKKAVAIIERTPLSEDIVKSVLSEHSKTDITIQNDIYRTYQVYPPVEHSALKTTLIYPATDKHVAKYRRQEMYLLQETAQDYTNITKPYINNAAFSISWVYNILEHKTEAERIVFEDPDPDVGFILLPDMKWNGLQVEDMYLVCIIHRRDVLSLRSLTTEHLPLLRNIYNKGIAAITEKYSVHKSKLRIYLHYQPTYYHLHVHFTHLNYEAPGAGVEKAHLLSDVIENIELKPDYYQTKTLSFLCKEHDALYKNFVEAERA